MTPDILADRIREIHDALTEMRRTSIKAEDESCERWKRIDALVKKFTQGLEMSHGTEG